MSKPTTIPVAKHIAGEDFLASIKKHHLVYFLLNVGDADQQLLLLPEDPNGRRRMIVVDVAKKNQTEQLIADLEQAGLVGPEPAGDEPDGSIALVVASHPHSDHIGAMSQFLASQRKRIAEFWDPGYYHTTNAYNRMMGEIEANKFLAYAQPTAGLKKWIGSALVTVLSPSVQLRNRFDTYGTELNDSSISLRVEFPAARVVKRANGSRELIETPNTTALILGADAQTLSWAFVETDFPHLHTQNNEAARAIGSATGSDPLKAKVFKVSHHASKKGVNLELVERINPTLILVSSTGDGPKHHFPHGLAQEALREAKDQIAGDGRQRTLSDWQLNILYTADTEATPAEPSLGSIAVVMGKGAATVWRFGDDTDVLPDLSQGRKFVP
jgi:beta-lactamase superfamily II metal-dependent hydrolase